MRKADQEPAERAPEVGGTDATPSPTRMLALERQVGWVLLAVMAAAVGVSWVAKIVHGDGKAIVPAAIGLGLLAVLAAALWYGRRLITALAAMAVGFAPVKPSLAAIVFVCLAYGGILSFRDTRARKTATMALPRRPPRGAKTRSSKAAVVVTDDARSPSANRRYTPPKAKKPPSGR